MSNTTENKEFPINLFMDVFTVSEEELPDVDMLSLDYLSGVYYVIGLLNERYQIALMQRYRDHMTYREIGQNIGVTTERVRQIVAKGLRILRHPKRARYLRHPMSVCIDEIENKVRDKIDALDKEYAIKVSELISNKTGIKDVTLEKQDALHMLIDELDLSVRAMNCFRKSGIKTVGDIIIAFKTDHIHCIRNLGNGTIRDICNVMKALGFSNEDLAYDENFTIE